MPLYEYLCKKCNVKFEILHQMLDTKERTCSKCGSFLFKQISLPSPGGSPGEVWEYDYAHKIQPKYVRDKKGNKIKFNSNTMRKGRKGSG
jgi:putative FmdB family regulatory protein